MALAQKSAESGNIFFAIFGAVALLGILAAGTMTFIKGPLATSVKLNRQNVAENQMMIAGQVAVMSAASQPNSGDCDSDAYVEPLEWRDAGALPKPTGGGLVPSSIGIAKKDPWGTEYGYCGWDHGPQINGGGTCGGAGQKRLGGGNTNSVPVVALISAGPDKVFTTTCRTYAAADVNSDGDLLDATDLTLVSKAALTDDDVIFSYTYQEATAASGGLWSLKSGDSGTAVINKNIEATGTANLQGGIMLADKALITCDATTAGVMAMNGNAIEICDGAGAWTAITGGGGFGTTAVCAAPADAGNIRYNTVTGQPEFCDGTGWRPFTLASNVANLVFTPTQENAMNVDGSNNLDTTTCTVPSGYSCGSAYTFTLQNQGGSPSAVVGVSLTNTTNFAKTADTCNGATLAINGSCIITIKPKADGNMVYNGVIQITANNNPFATMQGTATNFGCLPGRTAPGGRYASCGVVDPATGSTFNLVAMASGCNGVTNNPTCSGTDYIVRNSSSSGCCSAAACASTSGLCGDGNKGAQNAVNMIAYKTLTGDNFPGVQYCDDMISGGYSDWYLPAVFEMVNYVFPNRTSIGGFQAAGYLTSTLRYDYGSNVYYAEMSNGSYSDHYPGTNFYIRCFRRDNLPMPTVTTDITPEQVSIVPQVVFTPSTPATSNTITINGLLQTVTVTITGGTGMNIIKNGTSTGATSISGVKPGDTLAFTMDGPAVLGTKTNATVTIGSSSFPWWIGYADSAREAKIFVTTASYRGGEIGGLSGADAICNAQAALSPFGLSSSWKAILGDDSNSPASRIPWNWGTLKNINGDVVVNGGFTDLFDSTLDMPIAYTQMGVATNKYVWTAAVPSGGLDPGSFNAALGYTNHGCTNWTGNYSYVGSYMYAAGGYAGQQSSGWIQASGGNCADPQGLYCIENIDTAADTVPTQISPTYLVQVPTSARQNSTAIIIGGMSTGATATLSVSATGGTPTFAVNGGAEVTSGTIQNGDSVVFYMTSPATASTSYRMTISAGSMTGYWRVWTGDPTGTVIKRVFVTSTDPNGGGFGGVAGGDPPCQSAATSAGLGGTWKAIISGITESEYAINRVGYNWTELQLVDGTTVAYAGGLWQTLLSPIIKTETGSSRPGVRVLSGTGSDGKSYTGVADLSNQYNWTGAACSATYYQGNSSSLSAVITQGYWLCQGDGALYCIEQ